MAEKIEFDELEKEIIKHEPEEDPRSEVYKESLTDTPIVQEAIKEKDTALVLIDMQYYDAAEGYGILKDADSHDLEYYFERLQKKVIPNQQKLLNAFRENKLEVIHVRIQSLTQDGRDRSPAHKKLGIHAPPGSKLAEFIPEVAPQGDEIIINKTASGVFGTTNIEFVLQNIGIKGLFIVGVFTNECVSSTIRSASDKGFLVTMIDDACAAITPDLHYSAIKSLKDRYARVISTKHAVDEITSLVK